MQGYVLYRELSGDVVRVTAEATSRKVLRSRLEEKVPETRLIVGMILGEDPTRQLRSVA